MSDDFGGIAGEEARSLRGSHFDVLDKGFVRVVDLMGDDGSIADAARISYGAGTRQVRADRHLIRYLMRHAHTTPFEMCSLKIAIRCPMDVGRQWMRHRMFSYNEYSTRYSVAPEDMQKTKPEEWRMQSDSNRQGSGGFLIDSKPKVAKHLSEREAAFHKEARAVYEERLKLGVAREQARKDLPLSNYTEYYAMGNLHSWLHFSHLRMDSHAQKEIRDYADVIGNEIIAKWCPAAWEAFCDYRVFSASLSAPEQEAVKACMFGQCEDLQSAGETVGMSKREIGELQAKCKAAGWPMDAELLPEQRKARRRSPSP